QLNGSLGTLNTAIGYRALAYNTNGGDNTATGSLALFLNTTGVYNCAFGETALQTNTTGNCNTGLGFGADVSSANLTNATAIGCGTIVNASDKMQLGSTTATIATTGSYSVVSDGRFKDDVKENDAPGLDFINNLRPVSYLFNYKNYDDFVKKDMDVSKIKTDDAYQQQLIEKGKVRQVGFIAQEVEKTVKDNGYTFNGVYVPQNDNDNYAIDYSKFVVPLVKSVQELSKQNGDLETQNAEMKSQLATMQSQIDALINGTKSTTESKSSSANFSVPILNQIAPNPFSQSATISFSLPVDVTDAQLLITDLSGKILKSYSINSGATQQIINGNELIAGSYLYSISVNGKVMDSKQMVVTH
ncbi:MAG: tail fiber domain-containing protein, partial [Chitinophagales bacterium]